MDKEMELHIEVYNGDDGIGYIKEDDFINTIKKIQITHKQIDQLQNRIDKAIEYIEQNTKQVISTFYGIPDCEVFDGNIKDIVKILKGSDKE